MIVTVQSGQTLMDIAVQYYGTANALIELAADNNLLLSDEVQPGQKLNVRDVLPNNAISIFADYIAEINIVIVSKQAETNFDVLGTNDDEGITDNDNNGIQI